MPGNDLRPLGGYGPDSPYADLRWPLYDPTGIIQQDPRDRYPQPNWPWPDVNINIPIGGNKGGGGGVTLPPDDPNKKKPDTFGVDDFLKQWLPTIILGVTGILGARSSSDAAERIATIQGEGVQKGIDLTREMFNKGVELNAPWHNRGKASLYKLSDFMGLDRDETMSNLPPSTLRTNPTGRPALAPGVNASGGMDEWDTAAARFGRR